MKTLLFAVAALGMMAPLYSQQTSAEAAPQAGTAASSKNWLIGRWEFDHEFTQSKQGQNKGDVGIGDAAASVVASQLLEKMKGATLVVTENEITMARSDGTGKLDRYTLVPGTDPNVLQLKQESGEVLAFHRDGDRVWTTSTGTVNEPFFFKRAK